MTGTMSDSKVVEISCIKFSKAELKSMGIKGTHVVFLQYKFDAAGISANATSGGYMVYDPTVTGAVDDSLPTVVYDFDEESSTTTTTTTTAMMTTTTTTTVLAYHKVIGRMTLDVTNPEEFV